MPKHHTLRLGRPRTDIERELAELNDRLSDLAKHIDIATKEHDFATVQDLSIEAFDVSAKIEQDAFLLELQD